MPKGIMRDVVDAAVANGLANDSGLWGIEPDAFGDHAKPPTFVVDVRPWVSRKLEAIRSHRTQVGPNSPFKRIDDVQARELLGFESFRRAPTDSHWDSVIEQLGEPVGPS
jgi:LmbE family N-acetylglucosaminyl deacetylase